jgi:hypothetical protein
MLGSFEVDCALLDVFVIVAVDTVSSDELLWLLCRELALTSWLQLVLLVGVVDGDELGDMSELLLMLICGFRLEENEEFRKVDALDEVFFNDSSWFRLVEFILCKCRWPWWDGWCGWWWWWWWWS